MAAPMCMFRNLPYFRRFSNYSRIRNCNKQFEKYEPVKKITVNGNFVVAQSIFHSKFAFFHSSGAKLFSQDPKNDNRISEVSADHVLSEKATADSAVPPHEEKDGDSDKSKSEKKSSSSKWTSSKNAWKLGLVFLGGMGIFSLSTVFYEWGSPALDADGKVIEDEFSHLPTIQQYYKRSMKAVRMYNKIIQDPSREKLLPDALKEPYYQPPYTLVIEMTGVLVNPEWTYGTGWRFKKRPGVEYFLQQAGYPQFEIVIYTAEQGFTAFPILDSLDPNGFIMYRLFRDATRYIKGHHVKDLDCLNRDLSKVIIIDHNAKSFQLNPRNALHLKRWKGDDTDRTLMDLVEFLKATISTTGVEDVRNVLEYYNQFDDPIEAFRANQRRIQEEQEQAAQIQAETVQKKSLTSSYSGFFGRRR